MGAAGATGPTGPQGPPGVAGLNYQGAYAAGVSYALHDVVAFAGSSYVSLVDGNEANTPGVTTQWAVLAQGGTGSSGSGVGVAYQGTYASTANYALNDIVTFGGSSYISLIGGESGEHAGCKSSAMGCNGSGCRGAAGATGATGATGPAGLIGPADLPGHRGHGYGRRCGSAGASGVGVSGQLFIGDELCAGGRGAVAGASYASLLDANHGNTPSDSPGQWGVLTAQGPTGARGRALTFTENPAAMGYPSFHNEYWNPLWKALCDTNTVMNVHIGSSGQAGDHGARCADGRDDHPAADEHRASRSRSTAVVASRSRSIQDLKVALSEGGTGWIPYFLERAEPDLRDALNLDAPEFRRRQAAQRCLRAIRGGFCPLP